eukprot:2604475-Amphidinium_carterae.1
MSQFWQALASGSQHPHWNAGREFPTFAAKCQAKQQLKVSFASVGSGLSIRSKPPPMHMSTLVVAV